MTMFNSRSGATRRRDSVIVGSVDRHRLDRVDVGVLRRDIAGDDRALYIGQRVIAEAQAASSALTDIVGDGARVQHERRQVRPEQSADGNAAAADAGRIPGDRAVDDLDARKRVRIADDEQTAAIARALVAVDSSIP